MEILWKHGVEDQMIPMYSKNLVVVLLLLQERQSFDLYLMYDWMN